MPTAEQFVSEAIRPDIGTVDTARMAAGEPGLPRVFRWKTHTIRIASIVRTWRETGPCDHGSSEAYVRKHWFEVVTDAGQIMKIYFERQPRSGKNRNRWWLYTVREKPEPASGTA